METAAGKLTEKVLAKAPSAPGFEELYTRHFNFVWRNLRRLGVPEAAVEDATQDTFVVVHRRIGDLRSDASPTGWLFAIALRVARDYRRRQRRKSALSLDVDAHPSGDRGPFERAVSSEAVRVVGRFLQTLDQHRRAVFVLAELEGMSAPEVSRALSVRVNTVYSRLRGARERFVAFSSKPC